MSIDTEVRSLADRLEIHQVLMRYSRAIDRGDLELLRGVYHEGALDRHADAPVNARTKFAPEAVAFLDGMGLIGQHHITNYLIELDGDQAAVESYFLGFTPLKSAEGEDYLSVAGGRYLDRFERRDGRWAIADRQVVVDWSRASVSGDDWPAAAGFLSGARREADPSHALFAPR